MNAIEKLVKAIEEARAQSARYSAAVEQFDELGDEDAADEAREHLDEWDSWLEELETQLETINIDAADVLANRPKEVKNGRKA